MSEPSSISTTSTLLGSLPPGTRLLEYKIEHVLGHGGFGITYLARDTHLDKRVAIKEYLPTDLAARDTDQAVTSRSPDTAEAFRWGLESFIKEARVLAKFSHPSLIQVHRYFEANRTAYFVMEYAEGVTLSTVLRHEPTLPEERLRGILLPILDGLEEVHRLGVLHRDIKPDNIILREGSAPVLIDFGAARQTLSSMTRSVMSVLTAGYAPIEQYATSGNQGPWTDLYAVGAVAYRALSGKKPIDAVNRIRDDPMVPAAMLGQGNYSPHFLAAIDWALAVNPEDRPASVADFKLALEGSLKPPELTPSGRHREPLHPPAAAGDGATVLLPKRARKRDWARWISFGGATLVAVIVIASLLRGRHEPLPINAAAPPPPAQQKAPETAPPAQAPSETASQAPATQPPAASSPPATVTPPPQVAQAPADTTPAPRPALPKPQARPAEKPGEKLPQAAPPRTTPKTETAPAPPPAAAAAPRPHVQPVASMAPLSTFQDCSGCPAMVALGAGSFQMGALPADNANKWEGPSHHVTLARPFAIGKHEVTAQEWQSCVAAKACPTAAPGPAGGDAAHAPVVNVNWNDAQAYARWLSQKTGRSYRLPTEAEWEYAIRARTTSARYWGGDRTTQCRYGNGADRSALRKDPKLQAAECDDGFATLAPVGRFEPNAFGLYDMAGNAWEWTQDCWRDSYDGAPADGRAVQAAGCDTRVIRGGSWRARPNSLRSFGRGFTPQDVRSDDLGLRLVAE